MPYSRRWKWMQSVTGTTSQRSAALALGVSHATIARWLRTGIPTDKLSQLVVRFECDPIEALVVWGFLAEEDITKLNFRELVKYIPIEVLAGELSRRATEYRKTRTDPMQKTSVGMLRRA